MGNDRKITRRQVMAGGLALGGMALGARMAFAQGSGGALERSSLTLGLPVPASSFLPIYVCMDRTFAEEGLDVELVTFRGDAEVSQALAGGSLDVTCQSVDGLINLIKSQQQVIGIYAGFNQADFAWYAKSEIADWEGVRGGTLGVSTYGSLTDQLTRHALRGHGIDPSSEATIIQAGPAAGRLQALIAGQLDATILSTPHTAIAGEEGLTLLGRQPEEIAPAWPKHIYVSSRSYIDENPNTLKAFLRAHVRAIQLAKEDRDYGISVIARELRYEDRHAEQAYEEAIAQYDIHGHLPAEGLETFWELAVDAGTVDAPWTNDQILDTRFIDDFASWAPPA